jgi:hypothetical protein
VWGTCFVNFFINNKQINEKYIKNLYRCIMVIFCITVNTFYDPCVIYLNVLIIIINYDLQISN